MLLSRTLLCISMLLFTTCSSIESYNFKNKVRGLVAINKGNPALRYVFNANADLTVDYNIFYYFESGISDIAAVYRTVDGTSFDAFVIKGNEIYRSIEPQRSPMFVDPEAVEPYLVLVRPN